MAEVASCQALIMEQRHSLLGVGGLDSRCDDGPEDVGYVEEASTGSIFDVNDEIVGPLVSQLRNHLDSIRQNSKQVEGVSDAMRQGSIALDSLMYAQQAG